MWSRRDGTPYGAVVWAAGSLTPSELRAEKPDDVLFSGGGDRKPAEHCEVELVFSNEDGLARKQMQWQHVARVVA